jgi:uncharacterized protein (DUF2062 family)
MSYFRDKFRAVFQVKDTPHRIALAFAVGVFMGISPLIGLHYIGGFLFAWLFRLNKLVTLIGVSVNNPWTIVPISSFSVWVGAKLIGLKQVLPEVDWGNITLTSIISKFTDMDKFIYLMKELMPLIASFFIGSFVICILAAIASYFIILILAARYRKTQDAA